MDIKVLASEKELFEISTRRECTLDAPCEIQDQSVMAASLNVGEQVAIQKTGSDQRLPAQISGWILG